MRAAGPAIGFDGATEPELALFREDVIAGLALPQKCIPSKYLYDRVGSRLFDEITRLPEYYLTRTEEAILNAARDELAELIGPEVELIEFGAGSLRKVRILLRAMREPAAFVPIDISRGHLVGAAIELAREFPRLEIRPLVADFSKPIGGLAGRSGGRRVAFFPGSSIGNFQPAAAASFLSGVAATVGIGGGLLIGVDPPKDKDILFAAYNDSRGVTAAFNRNVLVRINRELGGGFDPRRFRHFAPYNEAEGRIEMHLVSEGRQDVHLCGREFRMRDGEKIHTENSYKYSPSAFLALAASVGFRSARTWVDRQGLFSVHFLRVEPRSEP